MDRDVDGMKRAFTGWGCTVHANVDKRHEDLLLEF